MNRRKKSNQILKARAKKANAKLAPQSKPKYISKADQVKLAAESSQNAIGSSDQVMNKINPKKLLNSKWTAVTPMNKEKHFLVTGLEFDEDDGVVDCVIEAVMNRSNGNS
jgi:tryptophan-rich hypothetical protein